MGAIIYLVFTFSLLLCNVVQSRNPFGQLDPFVRRTENGLVKGNLKVSSLGHQYYSFRSIPYAEPPITGRDPYTQLIVDRRFKAPEPLKRIWFSPLNVQEYKQSCLESTRQIPTEQPTGEDCLFLNIYVPADGAEKKTVFYWIHGGGFTEGGHREALYGPDFLIAADVILVAVQYRLGIFGFLNLEHGPYSGNMGLKDQQMGLKWVYDNIENFSGNRDEILLFGIGAGGASTTFHMLNKESRKYFNRALVMSGTAYSYFAFTPTNHVKVMEKCAHTNKMEQIVEYLKVTDVGDLIECRFRDDWGKTLKPEWEPTVEVDRIGNGFLNECPTDIWESENAPVVDTLFTMVSQEQVTFDDELITKDEPLITAKGESSIKLPFDDLNPTVYPNEYKEALNKLRAAYYSGATDPGTIHQENIALMSDLNFNFSLLKTLKLQAAANGKKKKTFFLRFSINDELNWIQDQHKTQHNGTSHAEELCYIFHCHMLDKEGFYDEALKDKDNNSGYTMIRRLITMIAKFARNGDPTPIGDNPFREITSPDEIYVQEITNEPKSTLTTDIVEQLRYDTWHEIEAMYKNLTQFYNNYKCVA